MAARGPRCHHRKRDWLHRDRYRQGLLRIETAYAAGDWIVVVDSDSRSLVYSLSSGDQQAAIFGTASILSPAAHLLAVENAPGTVDLYDTVSFQKRGELIFSSPVAVWKFSDDGTRLFVLTKDQAAYSFDPSRITLPNAAASDPMASAASQ